MNNNVLKGIAMIIFIILLFSCVISEITASNDTAEVLTLSKGGIVMKYPSDWGYSEGVSNYSVMAISKLDSIDSFGIGQVNINVEKKPIEGNFHTFVGNIYKAMEHDSSFELISSGEVSFGDKNALQYVYTSSDNGVVREHMAVWFEKGSQAYVIMYSAPQDQFESNLYIFEYILSEIEFI